MKKAKRKKGKPHRKKKRKGGKPTKATPGTMASLLSMLAGGSTIKAASQVAGITRTTFYDWKKRYPNISDTLKKAEAAGREAMAAQIRKYGWSHPKYWTALAWILERKYPDEYGRRERIDHTTKGKEIKPYGILRIPDKAGAGPVKDPEEK